MCKQVFWVAVALWLPLALAGVMQGSCSPFGCVGLETGKSGSCYALGEGHTDDTVPEKSDECTGDCVCWVPIIGHRSPLQSLKHLRRIPFDHDTPTDTDAQHCTGQDTGKLGYCYADDDLHTTDTVPEYSTDCTGNTTCWVPIIDKQSADDNTIMKEDGRADINIIRVRSEMRSTGDIGTGITIRAPNMDSTAVEIRLTNLHPPMVEKVAVDFSGGGAELQVEFNFDVLSPENGELSDNSTIIWIEISAYDDPLSLMSIAEGHFEFTTPDNDFIATWVGEEGSDATPCLRVVPGTKHVVIDDGLICPSTRDVCYFLENKDISIVKACADVDNMGTDQPDEPNAQVIVCPGDYPEPYTATSGDIIVELDGTNLAVTAILNEENQPDSFEVIAYDPHDPSVIFTVPEDFVCHSIASNKAGESKCMQQINLPKAQKLLNVIVVAVDNDGDVMHSHMTTANVIYEVEVEVKQDQAAVIAAGTLGGILGLVILYVVIQKIRKQ